MPQITRAFGAEERAFVLKVRGWRELEKARDCGLGMIAARLSPIYQFVNAKLPTDDADARAALLVRAISAGSLGDVRIDDVREPVLQGLIDGGLDSTTAAILVRKVFDEAINSGEGPIIRWAPLAFEIVVGAIMGLEDEPQPGERKAAKKAEPLRRRSPTAKPASPTSTPRSAPSATAPTR